MKSFIVLLALLGAGFAGAADPEGSLVLYEFKDGKASILIKGAPAEKLYDRLGAKVQKIEDPDAPCWLKAGRNMSCYSRRDKNEVQCVITVEDTALGTIGK